MIPKDALVTSTLKIGEPIPPSAEPDEVPRDASYSDTDVMPPRSNAEPELDPYQKNPVCSFPERRFEYLDLEEPDEASYIADLTSK